MLDFNILKTYKGLHLNYTYNSYYIIHGYSYYTALINGLYYFRAGQSTSPKLAYYCVFTNISYTTFAVLKLIWQD